MMRIAAFLPGCFLVHLGIQDSNELTSPLGGIPYTVAVVGESYHRTKALSTEKMEVNVVYHLTAVMPCIED